MMGVEADCGNDLWVLKGTDSPSVKSPVAPDPWPTNITDSKGK